MGAPHPPAPSPAAAGEGETQVDNRASLDGRAGLPEATTQHGQRPPSTVSIARPASGATPGTNPNTAPSKAPAFPPSPAAAGEGARGWGFPRRIAVVPAYNEEPTVYDVLAKLDAHPSVDEIVIVDDGSTDNTRTEIQRYIDEGHQHIQLVAFDHNRGMSAAYQEAFRAIGARVVAGDLAATDLILTVDADGQHDPDLLDRLIQITLDEDLAALVAERDLKGSGYTHYKRLGNWVMSTWATIWAGQRWYDVESGFRIFKVGPLLDALQYYKGYKYSETVEVAVILSRLGHKVRNDIKIPVPVFRSRTRLKDVAIDLAVMPAAWWRVWVGQHLPAGVSRRMANWLPLAAFLPLLLVLLLVASKSIFLGTDSVNNYIHVWYLKDQLVDHATLPVYAAPLDNGEAVTLPYGGVPWLVAALLFTLVGEYAVTLLFVAGLVALIWAAGVARREMRDPWLLFIFVINPFYIDAIFSFQFSFVWSAVFFFLFAAALDRRRWLPAAVLGWLAASTHPIMGLPPVALYLAWALWRGRAPLRTTALIGGAVGVALVPVLYLTLSTPAVGDNTARTILLSIGDVVVRRGTILLAPFVFAPLAGLVRRWWRPITGTVAAGLVVNIVFANGFLGFAQGSYTGIFRESRDIYAPLTASPQFEKGAHYRVLQPNEREDGAYYLVRHGAVLTSELFTESQFKRSFRPEQYTCFLRAKQVDFVVVEKAYFSQYRTNEADLLQSLNDEGRAQRVFTDSRGRYVVYDVRQARDQDTSVPATGRGQAQACFRSNRTETASRQ
ncbi:MAG: glycosyltransferase family 2 protein [Chloroflexi bacterium]|nr:glycosyltransferase family 2 protein [Chloroflexota bacterium]